MQVHCKYAVSFHVFFFHLFWEMFLHRVPVRLRRHGTTRSHSDETRVREQKYGAVMQAGNSRELPIKATDIGSAGDQVAACLPVWHAMAYCCCSGRIRRFSQLPMRFRKGRIGKCVGRKTGIKSLSFNYLIRAFHLEICSNLRKGRIDVILETFPPYEQVMIQCSQEISSSKLYSVSGWTI